MKLHYIIVTTLFLLLINSGIAYAGYYQLSYESIGLDTWNTSTQLADWDDARVAVNLPWSISFFGKSYSSLVTNTNGFAAFVDIGYATEPANATFRTNPMISPLWYDLYSAIYKNEYSDRVVFTWRGKYSNEPTSPTLTFQAVIYQNGDIRIRYGNLSENRTDAVVGISAGDNTNYLHHNWGNNSQTAYYKYLGAPTTPVTVAGVAPSFINFNSSAKTVKRSQTVFLNITIVDSTGVDSTSLTMMLKAPDGKEYGTVDRPKLLNGTDRTGVYQANWTVDKNATSGIYNVYVNGCDYDRNCPSQRLNVGNFTVNGTLVFDIPTLKASYNQTEEIVLNGTVKDVFGNKISNVNLSLSLTIGSWKNSAVAKSDINGRFFMAYRTSLADPDGVWKLNLKTKDSDGNEGTLTKDITIAIPSNMLYYNVVFLSPVADSVYYRGEAIKIAVKLLDVDKAVGNAEVVLKLPTGEQITLNEVSPGLGVYQTVHRLKWGDDIGNWRIAVQGMKEAIGGARSIGFEVRAVDLKMDILSPKENRFVVREKIKIKVRITYPDGTDASGIAVNATPVSNSIILNQIGSGLYEAEYKFSTKEKGRWPLRIYATDSYENTGYVEQIIFVEQPGLFDYMILHWYLTLSLFAGAVYAVIKLKLPGVQLKRDEEELKRLEELKKETQNKYFVEASIDETTFKKLSNDIDEKIVHTKARIKQLKRKVKDIETKKEEKKKSVVDWIKNSVEKLFTKIRDYSRKKKKFEFIKKIKNPVGETEDEYEEEFEDLKKKKK